jgi:hypothetical protein
VRTGVNAATKQQDVGSNCKVVYELFIAHPAGLLHAILKEIEINYKIDSNCSEGIYCGCSQTPSAASLQALQEATAAAARMAAHDSELGALVSAATERAEQARVVVHAAAKAAALSSLEDHMVHVALEAGDAQVTWTVDVSRKVIGLGSRDKM